MSIAGVAIPGGAMAREATELVRDEAGALLFDHSRRVFLWGSLQAERLGLDHDAELLYVGAMFHDLGLVEGHRSAGERQVPDYMRPVVRLLALGVMYDILGSGYDTLTAGQRDAVLAAHPRNGFETGMIEALSEGVRHKPETATATMLVDVLAETVPGYARPNTCDAILHSPFAG